MLQVSEGDSVSNDSPPYAIDKDQGILTLFKSRMPQTEAKALESILSREMTPSTFLDLVDQSRSFGLVLGRLSLEKYFSKKRRLPPKFEFLVEEASYLRRSLIRGRITIKEMVRLANSEEVALNYLSELTSDKGIESWDQLLMVLEFHPHLVRKLFVDLDETLWQPKGFQVTELWYKHLKKRKLRTYIRPFKHKLEERFLDVGFYETPEIELAERLKRLMKMGLRVEGLTSRAKDRAEKTDETLALFGLKGMYVEYKGKSVNKSPFLKKTAKAENESAGSPARIVFIDERIKEAFPRVDRDNLGQKMIREHHLYPVGYLPREREFNYKDYYEKFKHAMQKGNKPLAIRFLIESLLLINPEVIEYAEKVTSVRGKILPPKSIEESHLFALKVIKEIQDLEGEEDWEELVVTYLDSIPKHLLSPEGAFTFDERVLREQIKRWKKRFDLYLETPFPAAELLKEEKDKKSNEVAKITPVKKAKIKKKKPLVRKKKATIRSPKPETKNSFVMYRDLMSYGSPKKEEAAREVKPEISDEGRNLPAPNDTAEKGLPNPRKKQYGSGGLILKQLIRDEEAKKLGSGSRGEVFLYLREQEDGRKTPVAVKYASKNPHARNDNFFKHIFYPLARGTQFTYLVQPHENGTIQPHQMFQLLGISPVGRNGTALPYEILELVPGKDGKKYFKDLAKNDRSKHKKETLIEAVEVIRQLIYGYYELMELGLAGHGDMKLDNIMVFKDEKGNTRIKLIDLGPAAKMFFPLYSKKMRTLDGISAFFEKLPDSVEELVSLGKVDTSDLVHDIYTYFERGLLYTTAKGKKIRLNKPNFEKYPGEDPPIIHYFDGNISGELTEEETKRMQIGFRGIRNSDIMAYKLGRGLVFVVNSILKETKHKPFIKKRTVYRNTEREQEVVIELDQNDSVSRTFFAFTVLASKIMLTVEPFDEESRELAKEKLNNLFARWKKYVQSIGKDPAVQFIYGLDPVQTAVQESAV